MDYKKKNEGENFIKPPSDGTMTTHIPAFEISNGDGQKIKDVLNLRKEYVYLKATLDLVR